MRESIQGSIEPDSKREMVEGVQMEVREVEGSMVREMDSSEWLEVCRERSWEVVAEFKRSS